jgi:pilus assembly protein CpaC
MLLQVMEDASRRYRKPMEACRIGRYLAIATAVALAVSQPLWAQAQPQAAAGPLKATITDFAGSSQQITVPLNRSVAVETTVEVQRADVISREIADVQVVSPTRLLITGESYGTTTMVLLGKDNTQYAFEVTVEMDVARLNAAFRDVDPLADVKAQSVRGNLILTGTVSSAERAQRIEALAALFLPVGQQGGTVGVVQNHLDVAGEQQVLLRVVVAEVSRVASRELGVNGFLAGENLRDGFLVNQLGGINPINIGAAADAPVTQNIPFLTGEDGIPIAEATTLSLGFPRVQMQLFIQAMADNNLLSVLAEPNLVAISGETAHFLAGGEFPILVPQSLGTVSIEFREFGVRLNFTPVVRGQGKIRLRIAPEVSELDFSTAVQFQGFVVPGLRSRATETTVELGSGQTIAVAGLLGEEMRGVASRIPGIGDVPVLGALFRSVNYQRRLTELVVLVTPEFVSPLDAHQKVVLPNQGLQDPSDFELYALGLLERGEDRLIDPPHGYPTDGPYAVPSEPDELSIHGPWGPSGAKDGQ